MRVGIVGGGITGLATHHYLRERGVESVVFEADDRPGGVIRSDRIEGRVLDFGPQRTRLTPSVAGLVEDLGLGDELREAADVPLYVYHHGRLRRVPQTPREAVTTDLISWPAKLRVLLEPLTGPAREGETVEEFLTRTFGSEVARYYFGPLYGGLYGSHPDEMPMEHSLSRALDSAGIEGSVLLSVAKKVLRGREAPPVASFGDGLGRLPEALAEAHAPRVRLGEPVQSVERDAAGFALETSDDEVRVDRLVVTTPADVTADLFADLAPDTASALRELNYNPQVLVHLCADADLTGAGYQVQYDEDFRTLGATWNASLLDRDGVYTCYLGGSRNPAMVEWSDDRLESVASEEFEAITGHPARALSVHRLPRGMPAYDRSWTALDRIDAPEGVDLCTNYTARAGIPGRVREAKAVADRLADAG
ncbi:protoporphyrinogen oxidase [Halorussus salilacus]|uniref:protoporphyrinogen oxidase n=1 Tax=Halorussus salilacus TaxID=2953750 RepID=UPI00209ED6B8|nr:protoporphyrinogen oxidase [Halorussus salilacus]USZ67235.1 protoporphyrinogen oxidase [Halorussus salilacus]